MFTNTLILARLHECSLMFDFLNPENVNITIVDENTQQQWSKEIPIEDLNDATVEKTVKFGIYKVKESTKQP